MAKPNGRELQNKTTSMKQQIHRPKTLFRPKRFCNDFESKVTQKGGNLSLFYSHTFQSLKNDSFTCLITSIILYMGIF